MPIISCPVAQHAHATPGATALISAARTWSYRELNDRVKECAGYLADKGLKTGERVSIMPADPAGAIPFLFAIWRLKLTACLFNPRLPESILENYERDLKCRFRVIEEDKAHGKKYDQTDIDINQDATILLTSGSTADPKKALHTFANHYHNALASNTHIPLGPDDRWLLSLPLFHVGGLAIIFRSFLAGSAVVTYDRHQTLANEIIKKKITHVSLVPTQLYRLLKEPLVGHALKALLVGGSAIPAHLVKASQKQELPIYLTYGLTEMSSQVATSERDNPEAVRALPSHELIITEDHEICVKGNALFKGYINGTLDPHVDEDGWFHTGDLGELTEDRYLRVLGRKDNLFISGGENIQPEEIEKELLNLNIIEEAVVIPKKDEEFGHIPIGFIRASCPTLARDITRQLKEHLPSYKIPKHYYYFPSQMPSGLKTHRQWLINFYDSNFRELTEIT